MIKLLSLLTLATAMTTQAATLDTIPFKTADGKEATLKDYAGKVILIVNVASKCGNTKQYDGLEKFYKAHKDEGFVILAFPCNDFGGQEPGTNEEIAQFCTRYDVTFPLMDKVHVKGQEQSPLYAALTGPGAKFPGDVKWNFGKFLIGKNGEVIARFEPKETVEDPKVIETIETALK